MQNPEIHADQDNADDADLLSVQYPDPVKEKLADAELPGFQAEFDPAEAEAAGAFREDALSEADALDSAYDVPITPPAD
ncbi:hypothetical protein ACLB1G_15895 [Oxalobacteraceae bacterium A2-2]